MWRQVMLVVWTLWGLCRGRRGVSGRDRVTVPCPLSHPCPYLHLVIVRIRWPLACSLATTEVTTRIVRRSTVVPLQSLRPGRRIGPHPRALGCGWWWWWWCWQQRRRRRRRRWRCVVECYSWWWAVVADPQNSPSVGHRRTAFHARLAHPTLIRRPHRPRNPHSDPHNRGGARVWARVLMSAAGCVNSSGRGHPGVVVWWGK